MYITTNLALDQARLVEWCGVYSIQALEMMASPLDLYPVDMIANPAYSVPALSRKERKYCSTRVATGQALSSLGPNVTTLCFQA